MTEEQNKLCGICDDVVDPNDHIRPRSIGRVWYHTETLENFLKGYERYQIDNNSESGENSMKAYFLSLPPHQRPCFSLEILFLGKQTGQDKISEIVSRYYRLYVAVK